MASTRLPNIKISPGTMNLTPGFHHEEPKVNDHRQRIFKLTSTGSTYRLPNPRDLKPYVDIETGALDSWPAHAAKQQLVRLNTDGQSSKEPPKPKFLDRLEKFLAKELQALDCTDPSRPSEKRLQAFREVFEYLIDDFKTYRPLLSAIKNEYENLIKLQKEKIRELEPLQSLIVTISERCEKKLLSVKQDELGEFNTSILLPEIIELNAENDKLNNMIVKMRQESAELQEQVKKLQEEIAKEYRRYRDECDARRLLVQDLNDMKLQQDEAKHALLGKEDESGGGDAVVLRLALKKAREDLEARTQKLSEVMANFGDVVPSKDYERLDAQFKALEKEMEEQKKNYETLINEHSALINLHKKTVQQRDHFAAECEELKRTATPRPDWEKCGKYVEGGAERWKELSQDQSSCALVDTLLAEMTGQPLAMIKSGVGAAREFFKGLLTDYEGDISEIPRFLRCEGEIVNRRIGKRDCAVLINDIWKERIRSKIENPDNEPEEFNEFVFTFLRTRYGTDPLAFEWGYNLHDACSRYSHDPAIGLFNGVISGQMDENLYYDHMETVEKLSNAVIEGSNAERSMPPDKLKSVLKQCFPWKNDEAIESLMAAAAKDNGSNEGDIEHKNLFAEDSEGLHGEFLKEIESQEKAERMAYIDEVDEKLETETGIVAVEQVRQAFVSIDHAITETICNAYLQRGFGVPIDKNSTGVTMKKNELLSNLRGGCIKRVSERN